MKLKQNLLLLVFGIVIFLVLFFLPQKLGSKKFTFDNRSIQALNQPTTTNLFFAGDIMLSRNVDDKMEKAQNFTLPFDNVKEKISAADISFANLESPFNDEGKHFISGSLVFNADPKSIEGLKASDFTILSTANNHSLDQGQKGIDFTYNWLKQNNILPLGTGPNCHDGEIITKNNIKFGFLGYSYTADNSGGQNLSDPSVCDANDFAHLSKDIQTLKPKVDYLIVSSHMGIEYQRKPSEFQTKFSHTAINAGADLIIGNHPHWIEPIEQYQGKWIFYAMGNFVFDQMWSEDTRQGLTATITFKDKTLDKIELNPVVIDDFCCPRWANEDETKNILNKINPSVNSSTILDNGRVTDDWKQALIAK